MEGMEVSAEENSVVNDMIHISQLEDTIIARKDEIARRFDLSTVANVAN